MIPRRPLTAGVLGQSIDDSRRYRNGRKGDEFRTRQTQYQWQNDFRLPLGSALLAFERLEERVSSNLVYDRDERRVDSVVAGSRRARRHGSLAVGRQSGRFDWNLEWRLHGKRYDDKANTQPLGGYALVNFQAGYRFAPAPTTFSTRNTRWTRATPPMARISSSAFVMRRAGGVMMLPQGFISCREMALARRRIRFPAIFTGNRHKPCPTAAALWPFSRS
jgi:hypothetical protein